MRGLSALKSGMLPQLFRRLPKFGYVGGITGFVPDSITTISCIGRQ